MNEKLHKILYIALSLLLAVAFWLFVDNEQENTIERPFNGIPVEFIGAEDALPSRNLMLSGGMDATLDVVVRGPRAIVSGMKREDLRAQVNVSNINSVGTYPLSYTILTPDNIRPGEITTECSRSAVTVQVSTLYSRTLPVSVNVTGDVVDGCIYMGERMLAEPSTLTISGRAEDVDQVETVRVTVDLTGANSTIQREFDYQLLDAEGNEVETSGLRLSERRVQVTAPVFITKELPLTVKIKEAPGSLEKDARCELADQTITVAGEAANLENVDEILLGEVDLSALLSSTDIPPGHQHARRVRQSQQPRLHHPLRPLQPESGDAELHRDQHRAHGAQRDPEVQPPDQLPGRAGPGPGGGAGERDGGGHPHRGGPDGVRLQRHLLREGPGLRGQPRPGGGHRRRLHRGLQDHFLGGSAMTQIGTVTAVPEPGAAVVQVARQSACAHNCAGCAGV